MRIALHTRVRCDPAMLASLAANPVNIAWQAQMAELLDAPHDYSAAGGDAVLPVVWAL
jgi:L-rhamnose mutarotase